MTGASADVTGNAVRRVLLSWVRRYASFAAVLVGVGVIVAAAPSRSPRDAEFDYRQFAVADRAPRPVPAERPSSRAAVQPSSPPAFDAGRMAGVDAGTDAGAVAPAPLDTAPPPGDVDGAPGDEGGPPPSAPSPDTPSPVIPPGCPAPVAPPPVPVPVPTVPGVTVPPEVGACLPPSTSGSAALVPASPWWTSAGGAARLLRFVRLLGLPAWG